MQSNAQPWKEAMRPVNYEVMFDVEDNHWWFVGRRAIVSALIEDALGAHASERAPGAHASERALGAHASSVQGSEEHSPDETAHARKRALPGALLLDIGCGTGATMDLLQRYGRPHGVDLSELPLIYSRKRGHHRVLRANATELPFDSGSFDIITALDVVEHLDDDVKGLSEMRRVLKPGAFVVIFVPAFQSLWGPNDDQSGHKRRYRLNQLRGAVEAAGLSIERISYANIAMFVPIWLGRKLLTLLGRREQAENRINHPLINNILTKVFSSEARWLRRRRLPFGVSIICVARKTA